MYEVAGLGGYGKIWFEPSRLVKLEKESLRDSHLMNSALDRLLSFGVLRREAGGNYFAYSDLFPCILNPKLNGRALYFSGEGDCSSYVSACKLSEEVKKEGEFVVPQILSAADWRALSIKNRGGLDYKVLKQMLSRGILTDSKEGFSVLVPRDPWHPHAKNRKNREKLNFRNGQAVYYFANEERARSFSQAFGYSGVLEVVREKYI